MATSFRYSSDYEPPAPVVEVTVRWRDRQVSLPALLDSGADATMLPMDVLQEVRAEYVESRRVRGISGISHIADLYTVVLQIGPHQLAGMRVVSLQHNNEAIIGRDLLNHLIVTLDGIDGMVEIS